MFKPGDIVVRKNSEISCITKKWYTNIYGERKKFTVTRCGPHDVFFLETIGTNISNQSYTKNFELFKSAAPLTESDVLMTIGYRNG